MRRSFLGGFLFVVWSGLSSLNFFSGLYFIFLDIEKSKLPPNMCRWIIFIFKVWVGMVCLGRSHWYDKTGWINIVGFRMMYIKVWNDDVADWRKFSPYLVFEHSTRDTGLSCSRLRWFILCFEFWTEEGRRKQRKTNKRQTISRVYLSTLTFTLATSKDGP